MATSNLPRPARRPADVVVGVLARVLTQALEEAHVLRQELPELRQLARFEGPAREDPARGAKAREACARRQCSQKSSRLSLGPEDYHAPRDADFFAAARNVFLSLEKVAVMAFCASRCTSFLTLIIYSVNKCLIDII